MAKALKAKVRKRVPRPVGGAGMTGQGGEGGGEVEGPRSSPLAPPKITP